jgi:tetratricopeptide (TPR) repeat protein
VNGTTYRLIAAIRVQGRLREANSLLADAIRANQPHGEAEDGLVRERILEEMLLHDRPERAAELLRDLDVPFDSMPPLAPPLLEGASIFAAAGDVARARELLDRFASPQDRAQPWIDLRVYEVEGRIALADDEPARAVPLFRRAVDRYCIACEQILVGRAFEAMARMDSAVVAYERFLAQPSLDRLYMDQFVIGPLHERLGILYERLGNRDQAARHFARFLELWDGADQELQPRVAAARQALVRLTEERGD